METLKARLQESCDKAPSADGELEDGWNEIPRVRSAAGGRGIVPIPRVTSKQKSTARSAVSLDDEREKAPAVKDAQTEEDARPELPRTSGDPISLKRREPNRALPALNNPTEDGFQRRMGENEDGWHQAVTGASGGLTSDPGVRNQGSQAAPSMNPTVPGMFLFPTPEGMAQAHPVPPLGMVPPPPPPNMFMPVMHQNAFFPGAPIPPNLFGIPPPEHPQAQWQREAVKAAWLDHQIQHKQQFQHQKKTTVVHAEEMKGRSAKPARQQVEHIEILQREEAPVVTVQVEEIDSPPPAITDKVPPEAPKADTTTREVSSDEGEDGEDHVSTLHVLSQRLRKWTNPVFAWDRKDARGHWVCTGTVKVLFKEGEEFLKKTVNAKSRKRAKQKVSKQLIAALKEMIAASRKAESSGDAGSPSEEIDKMTGISTAVGALTQLFHRHKLDTQPDTRFEEIGGGLWRCTVIMAISGVGKVKVSEEGPQKKLAKSVASLKALERLRELKVIRPEEFSHLKLCQTGKEGREAVSAKEANKMRSAREDIVQISDDDDDDDDDGEKKVTTEEDGEGRFLLPKHYLIVEATKPEHCEEWRTTHAKPGSEIGVFVDSCSARREFDGLKTNRVSADGVTKDIGSIRVLCFSTKTSCLVVRKDKCTDEKSKDKDCEEGLWLPEAVCTLLCDRKIQKHGHNVDDGLVWLREYHGIQAWGMNDVSILSSASRSWSHCSNTRVLHGIHELMKYWLKKELVSVCLKDVWRKGSASDEAVVPEGDDTTGMAVVSAFACMCIQEQIRDEAVHKRTRLYGAAAEFRELSKRLMHDPFAK
ncbi:unnamed protein product [Chondrus crispus]|uniref:Uncharacterized protein n=1 Tax=Chondrus crispus TaxID=2769 RepID=R7QJ53_CHOCR|nr:unnamed protein product [Chondrus crispus]CDF37445.1 unnamed protein product [Chondrus crispus]|eukprot:XP_005717264.1 unnamed protein product [Chondrus crispus]